MGFQNANENVFHRFGNLALEMFWKYFQKEFVRAVCLASSYNKEKEEQSNKYCRCAEVNLQTVLNSSAQNLFSLHEA